jgi:hypothetical protein
MKKTEGKIQQEIVMWHRNTYGLKHHNPRDIIFSVPNERQNKIEQMRMIATGLMAGVSDLIVVMNCKIVFVECKDDTGRQSDRQKEFERLVTDLGFTYVLVRSLEEYQNKIHEIKANSH